jgi:hypothetical protein
LIGFATMKKRLKETTMTRRLLACLSAVLLALVLPSQAAAQATGQINGIVTDARAPRPVTIEVTNRATGVVRTAVTGADGLYTLPLMAGRLREGVARFRTPFARTCGWP